MKTKYMNKEQSKRVNLSQFPNAGPYPNITGIKALYWGKDTLCIRSGAFVYNVSSKPSIYHNQ